MVCKKCNTSLPDIANYCYMCGLPTKGTAPAREPKKRKNTRRPNGSGSITKLSGNRKNPYLVRGVCENGKTEVVGTYPNQIAADAALAAYILKHNSNNRALWTLKEFYDDLQKSEYFTALDDKSQASHKNAWRYLSAIGSVKMREIKTSHFQSVIDSAKVKNGRSVCEKIKNLSSLLCQRAMRDDIMDKNYALLLELPESTKHEINVFTDDEINVLKAHDANKQAKYILILIYTGMRESELLDLRIEDIDTVHWFAVGGSKTEAGKNRIIPIVECIRPYVTELIDGRSDGYLVIGDKGCKLNRNNYANRYFKKYLIDIKILKKPEEGERWRLSPNSTRHTFATLAYKANIEKEVIRRVAGHTDFEITDKNYLTISKDVDFLAGEMAKIGAAKVGDGDTGNEEIEDIL